MGLTLWLVSSIWLHDTRALSLSLSLSLIFLFFSLETHNSHLLSSQDLHKPPLTATWASHATTTSQLEMDLTLGSFPILSPSVQTHPKWALLFHRRLLSLNRTTMVKTSSSAQVGLALSRSAFLSKLNHHGLSFKLHPLFETLFLSFFFSIYLLNFLFFLWAGSSFLCNCLWVWGFGWFRFGGLKNGIWIWIWGFKIQDFCFGFWVCFKIGICVC